jgi:hypothetical protein
MSKKIINIFFLISFTTFIFLLTKYYFSEKNLILINKSRSSYTLAIKKYEDNLPLLENDTNNIINYIDDLEEFKNKRKERIWENLISNQNE